jgi:uncharacterized protein YdeI (YjbR/CyaY-like superfamily)
VTTVKLLRLTDRDTWRAWLAENHDREREVWLVYSKARTGKPRIGYEDAVEEALCFGWIASIVRRLDDEFYAQKFTPRKAGSRWSALNRRRVAKLIREGRMTQAGLTKVPDPAAGRVGKEAEAGNRGEEPALPPAIKRELRANKAAWLFFSRLAPSYRRNYIRWVMSAKKDETRLRRLREAISLLAQNRKLGLK